LKSNPQLLQNNNYFKTDSGKGNARQGLNGVSAIYVKKWVDYSSKYGLGYLLSDGTTGIYFNDSTKMIIDEAGVKVDYINNELDPTRRLVSFSNSENISDK
jgi:polo-like kinase 1